MRRAIAFLVVVLGISALACGFLENNADVTYNTEIPVDFTISADDLCERSDKSVCDGESREAPGSTALPRIEQGVPVDIVEATGRQELEDASGRFKEITITSIDYEAKPNSLTFDTPETEVHLGPKSARKTGDSGVFKLTTIPSIPKMSEESDTASVNDSAQSQASELFKKLEMATVFAGQPKIKEGDTIPPSGEAKITLTLNVKFVANPVDAAGN
jgi:hypothetical protein